MTAGRENSDLSQRLSEAVSGREEAAAALAEAKAEVETLGEQLTAVRSLRPRAFLRFPQPTSQTPFIIDSMSRTQAWISLLLFS